MAIDQNTLASLAEEYGGQWGLKHSERLIHLVNMLGEGLEYDSGIIEAAAYLHDWGGYAKWMVSGVDHALRSVEVVRDYLNEQGVDTERANRILECIEFHHGGDPNRSIESKLFTDADALDMLGVVGTLRIFAMNPRDIQAGYAALKRWRDTSIKALSTEKGKQMAEKRIEETNYLLKTFEEETFGLI